MPGSGTQPFLEGSTRAVRSPLRAILCTFTDLCWRSDHQDFLRWIPRAAMVKDFLKLSRIRNNGPTETKSGTTHGGSIAGSCRIRSCTKIFIPEDTGDGPGVKWGRLLPDLSYTVFRPGATRWGVWTPEPENSFWTFCHTSSFNWQSLLNILWEGSSAGLSLVQK